MNKSKFSQALKFLIEEYVEQNRQELIEAVYEEVTSKYGFEDGFYDGRYVFEPIKEALLADGYEVVDMVDVGTIHNAYRFDEIFKDNEPVPLETIKEYIGKDVLCEYVRLLIYMGVL